MRRALVEVIVVVLILGVLAAITIHDVSVMVHAYHQVNK